MKNKRLRIFSFSVFISLILLLRSNYPVFATPLEPVPVAQSPFGQADRYRTDLFSGSATYNYPIKVPKGTNDLTPDVTLSYNSMGARDYTQRVGSGWQVNQDYIE